MKIFKKEIEIFNKDKIKDPAFWIKILVSAIGAFALTTLIVCIITVVLK